MEAFLKAQNIGDDIIKILKENDVDMEVLRTVTEQDLKEIGITSFGKRRKLYILISTLNTPVTYQNEGQAPASTHTAVMPFTNHGSSIHPTPGQIAQAKWMRMTPCYSLHASSPAASTSAHYSNSSTSEQSAQQPPKRIRLSEWGPLSFDLVGSMENHVEGRKYLNIKDSGIPPTNKQRKVIVNVAVAALIEKRGLYPTAAEKTLLAKEIIRVFPSTKDTTPGQEGFEHFYKSGAGFIEYRLKNLRLSCRPARKHIRKKQPTRIEPIEESRPDTIEATTSKQPIKVEDQIKEKVNWMKCFPPTTENEQRHRKLFRDTFQFRRQLVEQGHTATRIITEFPRFRDMPELINLDFEMYYNDKGDNFITKWSSYFATRIITHGKRENQTITELIDSYHNGDNDLCALLVVFKLLHSNTSSIRRDPMERGHTTNPMDFLIQHVSEGTDVDAFACNKKNNFTQPFILAVGPKLFPTQYYVIIDHMAVEAGVTAVSGFDVAFKAHCIFNVEYSIWTQKFWQFIGLHVYGIPMSTTSIVRSLGSAINNTPVSELPE